MSYPCDESVTIANFLRKSKIFHDWTADFDLLIFHLSPAYSIKISNVFFFFAVMWARELKDQQSTKISQTLRDLPMSSHKTLAKRPPDKLGFSEASVLQIQYRMSAFTQRVWCKYTISAPRGRERPVLPWYVSCWCIPIHQRLQNRLPWPRKQN